MGPGGPALPGLHALATPLLFFPFAALLPAAVVEAWKSRTEPGPRFALCWLVPNALILEASPGRPIHLALPIYGALAWLAAFALARPMGRWTRAAGAGLSALAALAIAAAALVLARRFGGPAALAPAVAAGVLAFAAGTLGALVLTPRLRWPALAGALVLGIAAHAALLAGLAPRLQALWLASRLAAVLDRDDLNPRSGLAPGPVSVAGFEEPSLVFALGDSVELEEPEDAARAISEGRPAVVEAAEAPAFRHALAAGGWNASLVDAVSGVDYVTGRAARLDVYRAVRPPAAKTAGAAPPVESATPSPGRGAGRKAKEMSP